MNILLVVPWDQEFGGVASVVGNLAKYLTEKGHNVYFLHPGETLCPLKRKTVWGFNGFTIALRSPFHPGSMIKGIAGFVGFLPFELWELWRLLRKYDIDIVNIHYPVDSFAYLIFLKFMRVKLVTSTHGADLFPSETEKPVPLTTRLLLSASDAIVAPSGRFLEVLVRRLPTLKKRGEAIHNGLNIAEMELQNWRRPEALPKRYILCIAHQNERKGLDVLLRGFKLTLEQDPSLELVLVGDGPQRKSLEHLAKDLSIDDRTKFVGSRGRTEIAQLLHGCLVFVLPSILEPFGIVIIEAMACKKAVVATSVGGIPEIIENGKNGFLVPPKDEHKLAQTIMLVVRDNVLRRSIEDEAYRTVRQRFMYYHTGGRYEELYCRLLAA